MRAVSFTTIAHRGQSCAPDVCCAKIIRLAREKRTISRVELDVYTSNEGAIAPYESLGFLHEGKKIRARILDGIEDDILFMALHL